MGVKVELFVATEEEAQKYGPKSAPKFGAVLLKGLTELEFESLWAILDGQDWDPDKHELEPFDDGEDSTSLYRLPAAYVERLQKLGPAEIATAAKKWAGTEEISGDAGDVEPAIKQLATLARSATESSKGLFLWIAP